MMSLAGLPSASCDQLEPFTGQLRLAVAGCLARLKSSSREHAAFDLRCYLAWGARRGLDPVTAPRPHLELRSRWMQQIRRFKPSTVSRRFWVVAGFLPGLRHRRRPGALTPPGTCAAPGCLHSHRPLGVTHLPVEALLTAGRHSGHPRGIALAATPGLPGLRVFEAARAGIGDLGEQHAHRVRRVVGNGTTVAVIPLPPAVGRAIGRAIGGRGSRPVLPSTRGARMDRAAQDADLIVELAPHVA